MSKLSPTGIRHASRCLMAGAMYRYVDVETGRKPKVHSSESTSMYEGTYFEAVLFDSEPSDVDDGYFVWSNNQSSSRRNTMAEIARLAKLCRKDFDLVGAKQIHLEAQLGETYLHGYADYIGPFKKWQTAVVDTKFTKDIEREWGEEYFSENAGKMVQAPIYSFLHRWQSFTPGQKLEFIQWTGQGGYLDKRTPATLVNVGFPPSVLYVCENRDTSESEISDPIVRVITIQMSIEEAAKLIRSVRAMDAAVDVCEEAYERYLLTKRIENAPIEPTQSICCGNYMTAHKGRCPFFVSCPWGRSLFNNTIELDLSDIIA